MMKRRQSAPRVVPLIDKLQVQKVDFNRGFAGMTPVEVVEALLNKVLHGNDEYSGGDNRAFTNDRSAANVVTSRRIQPGPSRGADHALLLDIDLPAWLIPSSSGGHSHLYVDLHCDWEKLEAFLVAAADIGLIEGGYANASIAREHTTLRLPGVTKEAPRRSDGIAEGPEDIALLRELMQDDHRGDPF